MSISYVVICLCRSMINYVDMHMMQTTLNPNISHPIAQVAQSSQSCLGLVPSSVSPCTMMGLLGANLSKAATETSAS